MIKGSQKPMPEKLEKYVPIPFSGCYLWIGSTDKDGYGTVRRPGGGGHLKAHREAWRLHVGDPGEKHVLHTCDIPCCINVKHMYLGNPASNGRDKALRGRARGLPQPGERNPSAKLKPHQVHTIKRMYRSGVRQKDIAELFGIKQQAVSKIVRGERWSHLEDKELSK